MTSAISQPRSGREIRSSKVTDKRRKLYSALVQSGARLFATRGITRVSVEDVLAEVGTSRGSFYGFFANKSELVAASLLPIFSQANAALYGLEKADVQALMPGLIDMYLRLWAEHAHALLLINEVDESVFPYIQAGHDEFVEGLGRLLSRAEAAGLLRNESAALSHAVLARTGVALLRIYKDHPQLEQLYRDSMSSLLLKTHDEGGVQ